MQKEVAYWPKMLHRSIKMQKKAVQEKCEDHAPGLTKASRERD